MFVFLGLGSREQLNSMPQERAERDRVLQNCNADSLVGVGGDVRNAFGGSSNINMGKVSVDLVMCMETVDLTFS